MIRCQLSSLRPGWCALLAFNSSTILAYSESDMPLIAFLQRFPPEACAQHTRHRNPACHRQFPSSPRCRSAWPVPADKVRAPARARPSPRRLRAEKIRRRNREVCPRQAAARPSRKAKSPRHGDWEAARYFCAVSLADPQLRQKAGELPRPGDFEPHRRVESARLEGVHRQRPYDGQPIGAVASLQQERTFNLAHRVGRQQPRDKITARIAERRQICRGWHPPVIGQRREQVNMLW